MRKIKRRWLTLFFTAPINLTIAWPSVIVANWLWGRGLRWEERFVLTTEFAHTRLPKWFKVNASTLGHAIFYAPGYRSIGSAPWTRTQYHEHVHVEQFEGWAISGFLLGSAACLLGASPWVGAAIWWGSAPAVWCGYSVAALLRGESHYWGAAHEEAAYALTNHLGHEPKGK